MGDTIIPAEEPEWRQIRAQCQALLARTKDLRIAQLLLRALLQTESLPGLSAGIQVLRGLLERYWESVYPVLDPAEDNDPTERMNVLASLTDRAELLNPLHDASLIHSKVFGSLSLHDLEIAEGKAKPRPGVEPPDPAMVTAALRDCDVEQLGAYSDAAATALDDLRSLGELLTDRVEGGAIPNLAPLLGLLSTIHTTLQTRLDQLPPVGAEDAAPSSAAVPDQPTVAATAVPLTGAATVASRDDVVRVLDALCDYYRQNEPSSPVPLLLKRARRLATKDFVDIMRDLVPEAMDKVAVIKGPEEDDQ
jgi:type VI secretion system protein ImpA